MTRYTELLDRFIDWITDPKRKHGHFLFFLSFYPVWFVSTMKGLVEMLWNFGKEEK